MKIRNRIIVLLALPLVWQLITVGLFISTLIILDKNLDTEVRAKQVVALTQEINGLLSQEVVEVTGSRLLSRITKDTTSDTLQREFNSKAYELTALVKNDKAASVIVQRFIRNCRRLIGNWSVFWSESVLRFKDLSQFISQGELNETMKVTYEELLIDSKKLIEMYGPVAKELQPQSIKKRETVTSVVALATIGNIALIIVLAVVTNRNTLTRLNILMSNIKKFSKGAKEFEALQGVDELAELDKAFRDMSAERNKLEEIKQAMRSMVSHDLRTPLTSILARLEMLARKYKDLPDISSELNLVCSESRRLVRLATTLLEVEKMEDGAVQLDLEDYAWEHITSQAIASVETLAQLKSVSIVNLVQEGLVRCDENRLIQVIVNLLSNAIKFSPRESKIELILSDTQTDTVRLSVLDEGPGIPAHQIETLFSKFHQLDQPIEIKNQGSGLGLYICKMLVQRHGGKVGCYNRETGGSCFWLELPLLDQGAS